MIINIQKLEANGYIVDQNKKDGTIAIYKPNGDDDMFKRLESVMLDHGVKYAGMKAELMCIQINN